MGSPRNPSTAHGVTCDANRACHCHACFDALRTPEMWSLLTILGTRYENQAPTRPGRRP